MGSGLDLVKMRVRKKAEFFNSGSCTPTSPPPKGVVLSPTQPSKKAKLCIQNATEAKPKLSQKLGIDKGKLGLLKTSKSKVNQGTPKVSKANPATVKLKVSGKVSPSVDQSAKKGRPAGKVKPGPVQHSLPKNRCAVTLKDYISQP